MILTDFLRALGQFDDPRFRRVVWIGIALALGLLVAIYALFLGAIDVFTPDSVTLPLVGEVRGITTLVSWASGIVMILLSVFLMVPVASAFTGLFLDDIAQAVEDRHYPGLPPVPHLGWGDVLVDSANFFGLLVAVNLLSLVLYLFAGPFIPFLFWAINGFLLGREYFQMVAMRRLGRSGARLLRAEFPLQIWIAGVLMAMPLSIPLVNLVVPVIGVATFTHLFHRLEAASSGGRNPDRAR